MTENRWYHVYLYLLICTLLIGGLASLLSDRTLTAVVLAFVVMAFFSFCGFLAEAFTYGLSAKAGGMFWMMITGYAVAQFTL